MEKPIRKHDATPEKLVAIYALIDPRDNDIRYIGRANCEIERFKAHLTDTYESYKVRWIAKLKELNLQPILQVICRVPEIEWEETEKMFIAFYKSIGCRLTNLSAGGDGLSVMAPKSPEFRRKRSINQSAYIKTQEFKPIIKKIALKNLGQKRSQQTKERIAYMRTGIEHSEETKKLLSEKSSRPRNFSDEAKAKMSHGKELSRAKKEVIQLTQEGNLIQKWPSKSSAMKAVGSSISLVFEGRQRTGCGFVWLYTESPDLSIVEFFSNRKEYRDTKVYQYSLERKYLSEHTIASAVNLSGAGVYSSIINPTASAGGFFWRTYKVNILPLEDEFNAHKQGKFQYSFEQGTSFEWLRIKDYITKNGSLEGFDFIQEPDVTIITPSTKAGRKSFGVRVIKKDDSSLVKEYLAYADCEKDYTWRVGEYIRGTKIHPEFDFIKV